MEGAGMERSKIRRLARLTGIAACMLAVIGWVGVSQALASPPTVTLSGSATDGQISPNSDRIDASVNATLSNGVASGSLNTRGRVGDEFESTWYEFTGNVTCMIVHGKRVTVGAFGMVTAVTQGFGPPEISHLPGDYAQVFTVEFGEFKNLAEEFGAPLSDTYGMLGEHEDGLQSKTAPSCRKASFAHEALPTEKSVIHLSPSITSPRDGHVSHDGIVKLSGTGEPNRVIEVYEVGREASTTEVTANADGRWSLTLGGLSPGMHLFTASAVNGSAIPANTVEVEVSQRRHHRGREELSHY
jgi:hypothetical protein